MRSPHRFPDVVVCASILAAVVGGVGGAAGVSEARPVEVIYTKKPGHPKAVVPGAVDLGGNPEFVEWKAMEDLVVSPDGSRWIIRARTTATAEHDTGIVSGAGSSGSMFVAAGQVIQESVPAPTSGGGTNGFIDFIPSGFGRFDTANNLVFGLRARTTQGGSTVSPDANRVFKWDGTTLTLAFKQGDLYTNLQDLAPNPSGDETVGNSVGSYHLLDSGVVGSQDTTIGSIHSSRRPAITYDRDQFHQINVTSITGLGGSGTATWTGLDANAFYTTPDGAHWWAVGAAGSPALDVMAYDGVVVLQQNAPVGGSGLNLGAILQVQMVTTGDWIARGRDNSGTAAPAPDWVVRNGAVLARTGDPITPGSTDHWGDSFYAVTLNAVGDYVILGNTDNPDAGASDVAVLNGSRVLVREGQPVDLDSNGQFDDDAFVGRGNNTLAAFGPGNAGASSWWLTDARALLGLLMLHDGAGNDITTVPAFGTPQAFVRITGACPADFNGDSTVNSQDFFDFLGAFFANDPTADFNGDSLINSQDFFDFLAAFFAGCG